MTHPKLRETITRILVLQFAGYDRAVTKAIAPAAEDIEAAVLTIPEIADALKREEDAIEDQAILDWLDAPPDVDGICGRLSAIQLRLHREPQNIRAACRAAMSGGEKLDGKDTPQDGK